MKQTIFEHLVSDTDAETTQLVDEGLDWLQVCVGIAIFVTTVFLACRFVP